MRRLQADQKINEKLKDLEAGDHTKHVSGSRNLFPYNFNYPVIFHPDYR